jgi:uncharacterized membrane protein YedE/YeeE
MIEWIITEPWPWYVAGPLIGLFVPLFLLIANKRFGVSSTMRDFCAACVPSDKPYFNYNWKSQSWNLLFIAGIFIGAVLHNLWMSPDFAPGISEATQQDLQALGIHQFDQYVPQGLFNWSMLTEPTGLLFLVVGGFLVGFGARYAGGCTSGHGIMGLSYLQLASLVAIIGFFIGGLAVTHFLLPLIL